MLAPFTRRACGVRLLLVVSSLGLSLPAHGQFGALRRAAERKVEQSAEDRAGVASLIPPTFDATTIEITAERLDKVQVASAALESQRAAARKQYEEMQKRIATLRDSADRVDKPKEREAYEEATRRYVECRDEARSAIDDESERKAEELAMRFQRDPLGAQKDPRGKAVMAAVKEMAAATGRGDAEGVAKAQRRLMELTGSVADSASLDKAVAPKCGTWPRRPASMAQYSEIASRADALDKEARAIQSNAGRVSGASVGMTDRQVRMFCERVKSWLNGMNTSAPVTVTFTRAEYDLLVKRRSTLRKVCPDVE